MVVTVLAHGAVEPWSIALFELLMIGILLLWGIKTALDHRLDIAVPRTALPVGALLLLGMVQCLAFTKSDGSRWSLSVHVEATRHAVTTLFFLAAAFVAAANFFTARRRLLLLANLLTIFGSVVAVFALIQSFAWDGRFYWLRPTARTVFGPFVNHNHFAGYMAMLVPIPLGLILTFVRGQARLVYGLAAVMMGTAAIVSGSRSGVISLGAAMILLVAVHRRTRRPAPRGAQPKSGRSRLFMMGPVAVVVLATIAVVTWVGAGPVVERFGNAVDALLRSGTPDVGRAAIWRDTIRMIQDRPLMGAGLGTYATVYPNYAGSKELYGLTYSHNDYLQVAADAGAVGAVIAVWFIVEISRAGYRGIQSRDPLQSALALGAVASIFAVAVQSLSDTDLQIPSNALLFLVLSAVVAGIASAKDPVVLRSDGLIVR